MSNEDWTRLAQVLEARITDLRMTQSEIQANGGPSPAKVREILNGRSTTLSPSKRRDLERAIKWAPGSIDTVLAGGQPVPLSDESQVFLSKIRHPRYASGVNAAIDKGDRDLLSVLEEVLETGALPENAQEQLERLRDDAVIEQFPRRYESLTRGRKLQVARFGHKVWIEQLQEESEHGLEDGETADAQAEGNQDEEVTQGMLDLAAREVNDHDKPE